MKRMKKRFPAILLMICMVLSMLPVAAAGPTVSVTNIFSNNMVLQRGSEISVFGFCDIDGTEITVTLGTQTKTAASADGKWKVKLPAMEAAKNLTLKIAAAGGNTLTFTNVAVGEVWLCGGQSNMAFELHKNNPKTNMANEYDTEEVEDYETVYKNTLGTKDIRSFSMSRTGGAIEPCTTAADITTNNGKWYLSTDTNFSAWVSAIGYIAAYEMAQQLGDVTIGLLNLNNGDTEIEAWLPIETMQNDQTTYQYDGTTKYAKYTADKNSYTELKAKDDNDKELKEKFTYTYWKSVPSSFYNRMIAPFLSYTVKGCFWYQGCNNGGNGDSSETYLKKFTDLTNAWRSGFENPNMPFITIQLAPFTASNYRAIREAQFDAAQTLENVYLVSTANEGYSWKQGDAATNAIHPWRKSPVAKRAAHTALNCIYNNNGMGTEYSHAIPTEFETVGTKAVLHFSHTGEGLKADTTTFDDLVGFEVSADGSNWVDAKATVGEDKKSVILTASGTDINYIRYGYNRTGSGAVTEYTNRTSENANGTYVNQDKSTDPIMNIPILKDNVRRTTFGANLTNGVYPTPAFRLGENYKSNVSVGFYGKNAVKVTDNKFKAGDDLISVGGTYYKKDSLRTAEVNYDGTDIYTGSSLGKNNYNGAEKTATDYVADFATKSGVADTDTHKNVVFLPWGTTKYDQWAFYGYDLRFSNPANAKNDTLVFNVDMYFEAMYNCSFGLWSFVENAESNGITNNWNDVANIGFTADNTKQEYKIYGGTGDTRKTADFSLNAWHTVTMVFDYDNQTYSVALDGNVFAEKIAFKNADTLGKVLGMGTFLFNPVNTNADTAKNVYLDNIKAYRYKGTTKAKLDADVGTATQTMNGDYDTFTARVTTSDKYTNDSAKAIAALYCDNALNKVSVSDALTTSATKDFTFDSLDKTKEYQLELFFWDLNTLCPYKASVKTEK